MKISLATIATGAIACVLLPADHAAAEEQGLRNFERALAKKNKACAITITTEPGVDQDLQCDSDLDIECCFCIVPKPGPPSFGYIKCMPAALCGGVPGAQCA